MPMPMPMPPPGAKIALMPCGHGRRSPLASEGADAANSPIPINADRRHMCGKVAPQQVSLRIPWPEAVAHTHGIKTNR